MPEPATVAQVIQIGPEVTPGTGVAAGKVPRYLSFDLDPAPEFSRFRAMGQKYATAIVMSKNATTFGLGGQGSYSELAYVFCSNLINVTPALSDTTAQTWTFTPSISAEDTVKTYTIESGSTTRAGKAVYGIIPDVEITFARDGVEIGGAGFAQNFQDNVAMTGSPTFIEDAPEMPKHINFYANDTFGAIGTTKQTRCMRAIYRCTGRFGQVWPLNSANASYAAHVELEPTAQIEAQFAYDSQGGAFYTAALAAATKYVRIECLSDVLAGAATVFYKLWIDMPCKVVSWGGLDDVDGLRCVNVTLEAINDATAGFAQKVVLVNKVAAL
jgi:hypothetical protein